MGKPRRRFAVVWKPRISGMFRRFRGRCSTRY